MKSKKQNEESIEVLEQNNEPSVKITTTEGGKKIVEILTIKFSGKRKIDWPGVEEYLKQYIGQSYTIDETDDLVYIGQDFPDEYSHSKDTKKSFGTIGKAKANASQAVPELIQSATNMGFMENKDSKHKNNAKFGWYRCNVHFALPITNDKGKVIGTNKFLGRMIIRRAANGKNYLYDIIDIKKET